MKYFDRVIHYAAFLSHSVSRHALHSPFVYDQITALVTSRPGEEHAFGKIENIRTKLLTDRRVVRVLDLGAGSEQKGFTDKRLSAIARNAALLPRWGRVLHRLVSYLKPPVMLELGTSLGIGAMYQASGNPAGRLITLEGCPETASLAAANFRETGFFNIEQSIGNFQETLPPVLQRIPGLDYLYVDGNHTKGPVLEYFNACLGKAHEASVFVFDDINWSRGMQEAWGEICNHPRVTLSIDLFRMGIVFFRHGAEKQHFRVRI